MMERTCGNGFPVLSFFCSISPSNVMDAVHRVVGAALLYTHDGKEKNKGTKVEVEDWLRRWWRGQERRRALVND